MPKTNLAYVLFVLVSLGPQSSCPLNYEAQPNGTAVTDNMSQLGLWEPAHTTSMGGKKKTSKVPKQQIFISKPLIKVRLRLLTGS